MQTWCVFLGFNIVLHVWFPSPVKSSNVLHARLIWHPFQMCWQVQRSEPYTSALQPAGGNLLCSESWGPKGKPQKQMEGLTLHPKGLVLKGLWRNLQFIYLIIVSVIENVLVKRNLKVNLKYDHFIFSELLLLASPVLSSVLKGCCVFSWPLDVLVL